MRITCAALVVILSGAALAQTQTPPSCPADRPVDDIIAEVKKQQSKKANRNKNPLPDTGCIFGWCRQTAKTPPTIPQPAPRAEPPAGTTEAPPSATGESSSKTPDSRCNEATELALQAAHNVEVGDSLFNDKNYRAAFSRYEEAWQQKDNDGAIHVRLGRVLEKLNDPSKATQQYETAVKLGAPENWMSEARAALARLTGTK